MIGNRRLLLESLERRQLLAGDGVAAELPDANVDSSASGEVAKAASTDDANAGDVVIRPDIAPIYDRFLGWPEDFVQEVANRLYVVDQHPADHSGPGQLVIFQRAADGSLSELEEIELDFRVRELVVRDRQVVLLGSEFGRPTVAADVSPAIVPPLEPLKTVALTVNLGEQIELIRQEFEGSPHHVEHEDGRVFIVSGGPVVYPAIYPPPEAFSTLTAFRITADGLSEIASAQVPRFGIIRIAGDTLIHSRIAHDPAFQLDLHPAEPIIDQLDVSWGVIVTAYRLGEGSIEEMGQLKLGRSGFHDIELSADGTTAIVLRKSVNYAADTYVDILDLSGDQLQLFESIRIDGYAHAMELFNDYVVLRATDQSLLIVDVNKNIDLAAENRIRKVELPENVWLQYGLHRASGDRIVLMAHREADGNDDSVPPRLDLLTPWGFPSRTVETLLLTVSLTEARVIGETSLGQQSIFSRPYEFFEIDGEADRFAVLLYDAVTAESRGTRFVFGQLSENHQFVREGSIPVGNWLEIDANPDRLIARETDRLLEYRWDNVDDPIFTPLGDPNPPIEAVDDEFFIHRIKDEHVLNVLANDVYQRYYGRGVGIVELIGAPEGAEILDGYRISIPGAALEGKDSLRFEYVISDGRTESSAVVEISILSISDDEVEELVAKVRAQAAEDFDVPIEQVEVTKVRRIFDGPTTSWIDPNQPTEFIPRIQVNVLMPEVKAVYSATLDGEITLVSSAEREMLVELGLRAVDKDGNVLEQLVAGEEFYLEFIAKDLRRFGSGVYAAFFDLVVPTDNIVLTGQIEYGDGFTSISGGSIDEGEVDEVGAIGNVIEHPGNALQQLLRIKAEAVQLGEVTLQPTSPDLLGSEILLRGIDKVIDEASVRWKPLTIAIVQPQDPLDADGNGKVSAADALTVINFLAKFGATKVGDLEVLTAEAESVSGETMAKMRRYDTNGSGTITSLDALYVINKLEQLHALSTAGQSDTASGEAELVGPATRIDASLLDDDEELSAGQLF